MADNYNVLSGNIKVFPAARRTNGNDPFSRLMSESTITSIINRLIDSEGFVITHSDANGGAITGGLFEFNIFGYYIRVEDISDVLSAFSSSTDIYASIALDTVTVDGVSYVQISGMDDTTYSGVVFSDTVPEQTGTNIIHYLKILTKVGSKWVVPNSADDASVGSSYIKFGKDTLGLYDIDGGEIQ